MIKRASDVAPQETPDKQAQLHAHSIIGAVQTPLGFFTLIALIIEAVLGAFAARASGLDFTILVCGILITFILLIVSVVLLLSRLGPAALLQGAPSQTPAIGAVAPSRDYMSTDFNTGFFKNDIDFFNKIRKSVARNEPTLHIKVEKLIVLHYIRDEFQIGFRAYEGLSPISPDTESLLPLHVVTDRGGRAMTVDYFEWNDQSAPAIGSRTAPDGQSPAVTVAAKGPRSLCIFKLYKDPGRPDWFVVNPFRVAASTPLSHYVVVRNTDLAKWNPNKFVFDVKPDGTIGFSSAVYVSLESQDSAPNPSLIEAEQLLSKFFAIPQSTPPSPAEVHSIEVRKRLNEIFDDATFSPEVTVFSVQRKANETGLILAYTFPE